MHPPLLVVRKTGRNSTPGWKSDRIKQMIKRVRLSWAVWLGNEFRKLPLLVTPVPTRHQVAATLCATRSGRTGGRAASGSQTALWRGFPQPGAGAFGAATAGRTSLLGWSGGRHRTQGFGACGWRVLRHEGICLQRQRSWCVSTDKEFAVKAADIVGLYLNPPEKALVVSVDEKPSIQALERKTGYVETDNGKIVRGLKSTYKRHGTLNLFAALEVAGAPGRVKTAFTQLKRREEFLQFIWTKWSQNHRPGRNCMSSSWTTIAPTKNVTPGCSSIPMFTFTSRPPRPVGSTRWKSDCPEFFAQSTAPTQHHQHVRTEAGD